MPLKQQNALNCYKMPQNPLNCYKMPLNSAKCLNSNQILRKVRKHMKGCKMPQYNS